MSELISVIIPCYNAEKTITRTLNSVLEQDYNNLEIILINDGSADATGEIIKRYHKIDARIKIINQQNSGVSVARNNGLKHAQGEYVIFLDADDNYTTPYAISEMLSKLKENNADMCICNFTHPCFEMFIDEGVYDLTNKQHFMAIYQDFFAYAMPWNKIVKRQFLTESFVVGLKFTEDEIFNLYNIKNIKKVVVTNEVLHNYFCAEYNPLKPASAVNSIYSIENFWKKRCSIWHMGMKTQPLREHAIERWFSKLSQDMKYVRCFDFFFWDFFLMVKNGVDKKNIYENCKNIFNENLFLITLRDKEKHGLKLKEITNERIYSFIDDAYNFFVSIKQSNKKVSMFKSLLIIFSNCFYDEVNVLNTQDILAQMVEEKKENSTPESICVNKYLNLKNIK